MYKSICISVALSVEARQMTFVESITAQNETKTKSKINVNGCCQPKYASYVA